MTPLQIAFSLLTRLPMPASAPIDDQLYRQRAAQSSYYYPLVGLVIGGLLLLLAGGLQTLAAPPLLLAALLLILWIGLTGALHLDGLADSADAWLGGFGDRERTLAIMKDPRCGPAAVVVLVAVLLLKFAALATLAEKQHWGWLLLTPLLARTLLLLLFVQTDYVRENGMGAALVALRGSRAGYLEILLIGLLGLAAALALNPLGWLPLLLVGLAYLLLRRIMQHRLGGTTGDTAGALVELVETVLLVGAALI
ncbi:adenosylcobinamide-GDP ribazoletransferase [Marinobacterium arenosum]|uniref:adenosylcobinamide-GDP ribazoletransferase n=1 Tax=Marinobacterium arenosum TaxID=2862496 RepID=UPI001C9566A5|nr:adenosylcobinamide-GDP ribazoletransferase [Marinobacterium arenosum]MBY4676050.1 adenosylcobinamide-GDP ribazoletransferase [Marinobacterium arenosum]